MEYFFELELNFKISDEFIDIGFTFFVEEFSTFLELNYFFQS